MRLLVVGLALLLLAPIAPSASAATPAPEFSAELRALYSEWLDEQEALVAPGDETKPWFPEAQKFLARARAAEAAGRVREGMFHLETFSELVIAHRMIDEASQLSNDADRRTFAIQRTRATHSEAEAAWAAFRGKMHGYDGELHSLRSVELAIYSGDIALSGMLAGLVFDPLVEQFSQQRDFTAPYVLSLVRASSTTLLAIRWADDVLDLATRSEGLPPKILDEGWKNISSLAIASELDRVPQHLEGLESLAKPVRAEREELLSIAFLMHRQRIARVAAMETIFGDATSRGKTVLDDAARFMGAQANNTTLDVPRSYGIDGVFTSDALDRVTLAQAYYAEGKITLDVVLGTWSSLDHSTYVTGALARMSPISPPPTPTAETAAPGALMVLALVALVGLASRRRRA